MAEVSLFRLVMALKRKCLATEERIRAELELSPGELNGLLSLSPGERLQGSELAGRLGISPSRASRVAGMLSRRGYVTIEQAATDRRSVFISLTTQGAAARRKVERRLQECEQKLLSSLPKQQAARINEALTLLEKAL